MGLSDLFVGMLNAEQEAALVEFQRACDRIAALVRFGDLTVTFHQSQAMQYGLSRTIRPAPNIAN